MKIIKLDKHHPGDYKGKMMDESHYDILVTEDTTVFGPDGEFIAAFKKQAIPLNQVSTIWANVLRNYNPRTDNRGTASGVKMVGHKKRDGTISKMLRVPRGDEVTSGVMGFMDRYPRIPYCRSCSFNEQRPEDFAVLQPMFKTVNDWHEKLDPSGYAVGKDHADRTVKDWLIKDTIYTTVTVNKNFRTAAHLDANNIKDGTASMMLIREGKYEGGYVVFPEWRFAVAMDTGDLVVFRNMKDLHGNTQIVGKTSNYQRCTLVFYYREAMLNCGSSEEELERAKRRPVGSAIKGENLNKLEHGQ